MRFLSFDELTLVSGGGRNCYCCYGEYGSEDVEDLEFDFEMAEDQNEEDCYYECHERVCAVNRKRGWFGQFSITDDKGVKLKIFPARDRC